MRTEIDGSSGTAVMEPRTGVTLGGIGPWIVRRDWIVLLLAIGVGAVLRVHGLSVLELQYDEAATGYFATLPWKELWGGPAVLEPNPPLFYSMAKLVLLTGGGVEQIRFVSAIAGTLCIPAAWLIARLLAGRFAAAAAACLVAVSPQGIAFSQYARAYAVLGLCLMGAFLCLARARRSQSAGTARWWCAGYALCSVACLYVHYTAIVVLAAMTLSATLVSTGDGASGKRFRTRLVVVDVLVVAVFLPWVPVLLHQLFAAGSAALPVATGNSDVPSQLMRATRSPFVFDGLPWIDVWLVPLALVGFWRFRASRDALTLLLLIVIGPLLMVVASHFHPMLNGKTLAWVAPFALIGAALGARALGPLRWPALVAVLLWQTYGDLARAGSAESRAEGWREVAAVLRQQAGPADAVFVSDAGAMLPLRHYGWPERPSDVHVLAGPGAEPWFRGAPVTFAGGPRALSEAAAAGRVWLLTYGAHPRHDFFADTMGQVSQRALHVQTDRLDLSLFVPAARR